MTSVWAVHAPSATGCGEGSALSGQSASVAPKHGRFRHTCSLGPLLFMFMLKIFSLSPCGLAVETHANPEDEGGGRRKEDEAFGDVGGPGQTGLHSKETVCSLKVISCFLDGKTHTIFVQILLL